MSADNGVYVGVFPVKNNPSTKEYYVVEAQAIENCDDDPKYPNELTDHYRNACYGGGRYFTTEKDAMQHAHQLFNKLDVCEYGVCKIEYDRPLLECSAKESDEWLEKWWASRGK